MENRRNCSLGAISPLFHIFYMLLDFHVYAENRFSLRDKALFEISEFEIARVNCILFLCICFTKYLVQTDCKRICADWSGPSLPAYRINGYYIICRQRMSRSDCMAVHAHLDSCTHMA